MNLPNVYATAVKKQQIDMTLSVNPLGCSPRVAQILKQLDTKDVSTYPDIDPLLTAGSERLRIPKSCFLVGNGSEQLIKLIAQTFLKPGDSAIAQSGSFSLFKKECMIAGTTVALCKINRLINQLIQPKILFLCNPNNPTGELIPKKTMQDLIATFPKTVIVIDEANAEFTNQTSLPTAIKNDNILILRTCSKAFGLAGLRVGFCIGNPKLIKALQSVQQAFPISSLSIKLATAALADTEFLNKTIKSIAKQRTAMTNALRKRGFTVSDSVTNTIFVSTPRAKKIIAQLNTMGVSVIPNTFFPGLTTPGFRIALRDKRTNSLFLQKLDTAIEQIGINLIR